MFSIRAWVMPPAVILGAAVISVAMVGFVTSGRLPGLATSSVPVSASRGSEEATTAVTESGETEAHVEGQGRRDGSGGGRGLLTKEADPTILITEIRGGPANFPCATVSPADGALARPAHPAPLLEAARP
jgi:hypothetical protein